MFNNSKRYVMMIIGVIFSLINTLLYYVLGVNSYICAIIVLVYGVAFLLFSKRTESDDLEAEKNDVACRYGVLLQYTCMGGCIIEHDNGGLRDFVFVFIIFVIIVAYIVPYIVKIVNPSSKKFKYMSFLHMMYIYFMMCNALEVFWAVLIGIHIMAAFSIYEDKKFKTILCIVVNVINTWGIYRQIIEVCNGDMQKIWSYILEAMIVLIYSIAFIKTSTVIGEINENNLKLIENKSNEVNELSNETVKIGGLIKESINKTTDLANSIDVSNEKSIEIVQGISNINIDNLQSVDKQLAMTSQIMNAIDSVVIQSKQAENMDNNTAAAMFRNKESFKNVKGKSNDIVEYNKKLTDVINQFVSNVKKVKDILSNIIDVAEKIDSLSLNASVESARAGEVKKEFSVVSNEIKSLSDATASVITRINKVINELETNALIAQNTVLNVINEIDDENTIIDKTMKEFGEIEADMHNLNTSIKAILVSINNVAKFSSNMEEHSKKLMETNKEVNQSIKEALDVNDSNKEKVNNTVDIMKEVLEAVSELDEYVVE